MENKLFKDLFGEQEGVISESAQSLVMEAFNTKVAEEVEKVSNERVELALESMDKEHTQLLQQVSEKYERKILDVKKTLEESIDEEHANAVEETFAKLDEDRTNKMIQVKEHYEGLLSESVSTQVDTLVEGIDKYLDSFLDKHIPTELMAEATKKDYSQELIKKISKLVTLDESVSDDIRDGMIDAKSKIDAQEKEILTLKRDNLIAEKTAKLPALEKAFMVESLQNKDLEFINRNFDYTRTLFEKSQTENVTPTSHNVDRKPIVIEESNNGDEERGGKVNSAMAGWASLVTSSNWDC